MRFKNVAELYDFVEAEARKRVGRILYGQAKGSLYDN
jgi:hypothetical protein